jgi:hypothetical protein
MMQMGLHEEYFRPELYNTFNLKQRGQKDTAPPNTAFILVFRKFVEKEIGVFFDSVSIDKAWFIAPPLIFW